MHYYNDELSDDSSCLFDHTRGRVLRIHIGKRNPAWRMSFCHELGHAYMIPHQRNRRTIKFFRGSYDWRLRYEVELLAWQIGKGICKPDYWDEQAALSLLRSYWHGEEEFSLRKIIPIFKKKIVLYQMKKIGIYKEN